MKEYQCNKCGKTFTEDNIIRDIEGDQFEGYYTKYLSPCCYSQFRDEW